MTLLPAELVLAVFTIFCRVSGCLMLMPGFSSMHIPMRVRLFIAIAGSLAVTPLLIEPIFQMHKTAAPDEVFLILLSELAIGALIGVMGRLFFAALEFTSTAVGNFIGLAVLPGVPVDELGGGTAVTSFISVTATALIFMTDLHWEILQAIVASYDALLPRNLFSAQFALINVTDTTSEAFLLAIRISSPFLIYAIIFNFMTAIANKLIAQIPIYFISVPFLITVGLALLFALSTEFFHLFISGFASWLRSG